MLTTPSPRTLHSFGVCTQEVLQALCSVSVFQFPMMQGLRGQDWKEGRHPSSCISICWKPPWPQDKGKSQAQCVMLKDSKKKKVVSTFYKTKTRRMSRNSKHFYCLKKHNMTVVLCLPFSPGNINGNKGHFLSLGAVYPTCY